MIVHIHLFNNVSCIFLNALSSFEQHKVLLYHAKTTENDCFTTSSIILETFTYSSNLRIDKANNITKKEEKKIQKIKQQSEMVSISNTQNKVNIPVYT